MSEEEGSKPDEFAELDSLYTGRLPSDWREQLASNPSFSVAKSLYRHPEPLGPLSECESPFVKEAYKRFGFALPERYYISNKDDRLEDLGGYCEGGHHPTHIGDLFHDGRYRILYKLGFGPHSLVWLARDLHTNKCVALKILTASSSRNSRESKRLRALEKGDIGHSGRSLVAALLDDFWHDGPNGRHRCIVTNPTGCAVGDLKSGTVPFPLKAARSVAAQVLLGLEYIHSCGLVHAELHLKDLSVHSISLAPCIPEDITDEELHAKLGQPKRVPLKNSDHQSPGPESPQFPQYVVKPVSLCHSSYEAVAPKVVISDFGACFLAKAPPQKLQTPIILTPPEGFELERITPAADIWTFACTMFTILGDFVDLFQLHLEPIPSRDLMIGPMIDVLGMPPKYMLDRWENRGKCLNEDSSWKQAPNGYSLKERLRSILEGKPGYSEEEMKDLEILMHKMLVFRPSERITAKQALGSAWMEKWGLPSMMESSTTAMVVEQSATESESE
ncbi:kinase-like protein [Saccharata proteae CBS 121410]|uniref:non-specific serine/threonine protein kinase n=1 Tax=Saccharata proteae CBS 121410 TaxID=1314787 RepID=A0A9P4HVW0_9PEZI|nr:kinase-like protein [Saccharata proteae CBS 121410]